MHALRVEVIESQAAWAGWRSAWERVRADAAERTAFSSFAWCASWMATFADPNRTLFVLAVLRGDEAIGFAPWYRRASSAGPWRVRVVEPIGTPEGGSDYLDVLARRGCEQDVAVAILAFLFGEGARAWDVVSLSDVPSDSLFLTHTLMDLDRRGKHYEVEAGAFCPVAVLPGSSAAFRAGLSANRRQQWARHQRRLGRHGAVDHVTVRGPLGEGTVDRFFALYRVAHARHAPDSRLAVLVEGYLAQANGSDPVQVEFLTVGGRDVAAALLLRDEDVLRLYLLAVDRGFSPDVSAGNVLLGLSLDQAVRSGVRAYDFLKGDEPYKFHWARGGRRALRLRFYQRRPAGVLVAATSLARRAARAVLR